MAPLAPDQDPHKPAARSGSLEGAIGHEVRVLRSDRGLTVAELAKRSGVSAGMLSKIENGNISASLTTLQSLAVALSVPISAFLRGFEQAPPAVHTKAGQGVVADRTGTRAGHQYQLLGHLGATANGVVVEPYMITLTEASDVFPTFRHDGVETLYMLEGQVGYRHGDTIYTLQPGDTLFFVADAPHGPERLDILPARFLSIIAYPPPE